jgi:DNA-binding MarR family transcriptional regulator
MTEDLKANEEIRLVLKSIRSIAHALDVRSRLLNMESGLTLPQLIVLRCVRDLGEPTGSSISKAIDLSPPTVLGILDKLAAKELILRTRPITNRRIVISQLTEKGAETLEQAPSPLGDSFSQCYFRLSEEERKKIIWSLTKVAEFTTEADRNPRKTSSIFR